MPKDTTKQKTDYELQLLVAKNNVAAFEELYLNYYSTLHQFAYRIIKSNHIAEEIVSDVFVRIWKKKETFAQINNLKIFLYVAVKNQALTYLVKAKRQQICWIEEFATSPEMRSKTSSAEELLAAKELSAKLDIAIDKLPLKCKAIFKLVKEDGLKYSEAAQLLNLSIKTIENQMGIALKKLAASVKVVSYS
jgi:RNA polymerase sigma-70 factor (ECF subfamily)